MGDAKPMLLDAAAGTVDVDSAFHYVQVVNMMEPPILKIPVPVTLSAKHHCNQHFHNYRSEEWKLEQKEGVVTLRSDTKPKECLSLKWGEVFSNRHCGNHESKIHLRPSCSWQLRKIVGPLVPVEEVAEEPDVDD